MHFSVLGGTALQLVCSLPLLPSLMMTSLIKHLTSEFSAASFLWGFYFCLPELLTRGHLPCVCSYMTHCGLQEGHPFPCHSILFFHRHASTGLCLVHSSRPWSSVNNDMDAVIGPWIYDLLHPHSCISAVCVLIVSGIPFHYLYKPYSHG